MDMELGDRGWLYCLGGTNLLKHLNQLNISPGLYHLTESTIDRTGTLLSSVIDLIMQGTIPPPSLLLMCPIPEEETCGRVGRTRDASS